MDASLVQAGGLGPGVEQRQVDVGDVTLTVAEAGIGGRPLLLVHGFTGSKEDFGDWIHVFAEGGYHVVAPDQRGHGASDQPEQVDDYSLATYVHDLAGLVDALGWDHFALLGHSMGGFIAECYAVKHPEQIERLVLMDTHHGAVRGLDEDMRAAARHIVAEYGMSALVEAMNATESPLRAPAAARVEAEREGFKAWSDERLRATSPAMWLAMSEELVTTADRLDALTGLRMPVLVIVGRPGPAVPRGVAAHGREDPRRSPRDHRRRRPLARSSRPPRPGSTPSTRSSARRRPDGGAPARSGRAGQPAGQLGERGERGHGAVVVGVLEAPRDLVGDVHGAAADLQHRQDVGAHRVADHAELAGVDAHRRDDPPVGGRVLLGDDLHPLEAVGQPAARTFRSWWFRSPLVTSTRR